MAINCDWLPNLTVVSWLPLTQTFPPEPIYILYQRDSFPVRDTTHSSHSHVVLLSVHPLRAQRSGEQASETRRPASRHLLGVRAIRFLGSVFRDCSSARSASSCGSGTSSDQLLRLLPGGRSRDCTANIYLHRLRSTTSSNTLCRLVWMEPPVPSALVPPRGTILNKFFIFSMSAVVAVVLAMFISNLRSDKIAHVHIYVTTVLCVIFWIKSNIKMSNFLIDSLYRNSLFSLNVADRLL